MNSIELGDVFRSKHRHVAMIVIHGVNQSHVDGDTFTHRLVKIGFDSLKEIPWLSDHITMITETTGIPTYHIEPVLYLGAFSVVNNQAHIHKASFSASSTGHSSDTRVGARE